MKALIFAAVLAGLSAGAGAVAADCPALLDRSFPGLEDGKPRSLCEYRGKVLLVVNTASFCGFTSQYEGLEALQQTYGPRGLVVLGFPSNDFGRQEPGSSEEIAEFCRTTYGVNFPMFAKSAVRGSGANPLYADLARLGGGAPRWNFHKYLVDRQCRRVEAFESAVAPGDPALVRAIEARLAER